MTREEWLNAFIEEAKPHFERAGYPLENKIRVSVGFMSNGLRSKAIGQCFKEDVSEDNTYEIFITPKLNDSSRIADVLTHELVHTICFEDGHGKTFKRIAYAMGLTGKPTHTVAGPEWHVWADPILEKIGPIPHAKMNVNHKKQPTAMIKCECIECGFIMRTSMKWIKEYAEFPCPCGTDEPLKIHL